MGITDLIFGPVLGQSPGGGPPLDLGADFGDTFIGNVVTPGNASGTVTPGGDIIVCFVMSATTAGSGSLLSSLLIDGNEIVGTLIPNAGEISLLARCEAFYLVNPPSGSVAWSATPSFTTDLIVVWRSFSGVDTDDPISGSMGANDATPDFSHTVSFTPNHNNALALCLYGQNVANATAIPDGAQVEIVDIQSATESKSLEISSLVVAERALTTLGATGSASAAQVLHAFALAPKGGQSLAGARAYRIDQTNGSKYMTPDTWLPILAGEDTPGVGKRFAVFAWWRTVVSPSDETGIATAGVARTSNPARGGWEMSEFEDNVGMQTHHFRVRMSEGDATPNILEAAKAQDLVQGTWYQVALSWDGTDAHLWTDGERVDLTTAFVPLQEARGPIRLGAALLSGIAPPESVRIDWRSIWCLDYSGEASDAAALTAMEVDLAVHYGGGVASDGHKQVGADVEDAAPATWARITIGWDCDEEQTTGAQSVPRAPFKGSNDLDETGGVLSVDL